MLDVPNKTENGYYKSLFRLWLAIQILNASLFISYLNKHILLSLLIQHNTWYQCFLVAQIGGIRLLKLCLIHPKKCTQRIEYTYIRSKEHFSNISNIGSHSRGKLTFKDVFLVYFYFVCISILLTISGWFYYLYMNK